jgi:glycogen(starch) synthase
MKILMLGWELPPYNSGGLGVACYQMCQQLAEDGVSVEFVLPYESKTVVEFMTLHAALPTKAEVFSTWAGAYDSMCFTCDRYECDHTSASDMRGRQKRYIRFVEQLVKENDYDAIHAHDWLTFEAGMRAKELTGKPLVAHVHATEFDRAGSNYGNSLVHEIEYNALLMADTIIAVSQFTKDLIVRQYGIPSNKIEVVYNSTTAGHLGELDGNNAYRYLEAMKKYGYKVVVSLSRLSLQKGVDHLLDAAKLALAVNPKLFFLVVGDGEQREELITKAADLGIAHNVIFTGFLRGKEWRDAYGIGDMFVMPSVSEPFGLTGLEAAYYGNAVLLSKQSGVGEVLRSVMHFDFWDKEKLANAILTVAKYDVLREALAKGVQDEVRNISWRDATQQFRNIYARHMAEQGATV